MLLRLGARCSLFSRSMRFLFLRRCLRSFANCGLLLITTNGSRRKASLRPCHLCLVAKRFWRVFMPFYSPFRTLMMSTENCAPVTLADGLAIVGQLRDLHERAELNAQTMLAFVF